jgi:hypothetical protein
VKRVFPRLLVLALGIYAGDVGFTQNSNSGDIRGTVTDSSGALVPGVNITVTNNDTGVVNKFVTNQDGLYDTNSIRQIRFYDSQARTSYPSGRNYYR